MLLVPMGRQFGKHFSAEIRPDQVFLWSLLACTSFHPHLGGGSKRNEAPWGISAEDFI